MSNRIILPDGTTIEDKGQYDETGLPETIEDVIEVTPKVKDPVIQYVNGEV